MSSKHSMTPSNEPWYVYIVRCRDATLYTGISNNVEKRIEKHNKGTGAKYTKTRTPVRLLTMIKCSNKSEASKKEYKIKQLSKQQKLALLSVKERADDMLAITRRAPAMFAVTRESLMNRVASILEMANVQFNVIDFYKKHLGTQGCAYATPLEHVSDDWAHPMVDNAIALLHKDTI